MTSQLIPDRNLCWAQVAAVSSIPPHCTAQNSCKYHSSFANAQYERCLTYFHLHPHLQQPQTRSCATLIPSSAIPNLCFCRLPQAWPTEQWDLILSWNASKPDLNCQEKVHIPQFLSLLAICFVGWIILIEICKYSNVSACLSPPLERNLPCPTAITPQEVPFPRGALEICRLISPN